MRRLKLSRDKLSFKTLINNYHLIILALSFVLFNIIINFLFFVVLYNLNYSSYNLSMFIQELYSASQGKPFYDTINLLFRGIPYGLAIHPYLILYILVPLYKAFPSWLTLSLVESLVLTLASLYLYKIAREVLPQSKLLPVISSMIFLFNPLTVASFLSGFQVLSFIPLFYLASYYYYLTKRWKLFIISTALLLLTSEASYPIVLTYMVLLIIKNKNNNKLLSKSFFRRNILFLSVIVATIVIALTLPTFLQTKYTGTSHSILQDIEQYYSLNYVNYDILNKLEYWLLVFGSFGALSLFSPLELLPALPYILLTVMSFYPNYYTPGYYYFFLVLPMLAVALVYTLKKIHDIKRVVRVALVFVLLIGVFFNPYIYTTFQSYNSPKIVSPGYPPSFNTTLASVNQMYINELTSLIPPNSSIVATTDLLPFVSNSMNAYVLPPYSNVNLNILKNLNVLKRLAPTPNYLLIDGSFLTPSFNSIEGNYGIYAETNGISLYKLNYSGEVKLFAPLIQFIPAYDFYIWSYVPPTQVNVVNDNQFGKVYMYVKNGYKSDGATLWFGPYIHLPQGTYLAEFYLKFDNVTTNGSLLRIDININPYGSPIYKIINSSDIVQGKWMKFDLLFTIPYNELLSSVEFRGFSISNQSNIYFAGVKLIQISPYVNYIYPACDFATINGIKQTQGNFILGGCDIVLNSSTAIWYGPYITLPEGNFTAYYIFSMDLNKRNFTPNTTILTLDISYDIGKYILNTLNINDSELIRYNVNGVYLVPLTFSLNQTTSYVEFRGFNFNAEGEVYFYGAIIVPDYDNYTPSFLINYLNSLQ
ncbi:DUF2079 domain-containing protein [Sulfolobus acidocaldarius]|uniref:Membrane protein n=4 Tax=Sulfolobus acidocaldarius TaxID=2285 RepID=Q4J7K9_SULAC|nr:DUF2079 domain-containing protein [Sulfolobus acidocaldarius]AAY81222.1 membrane protein [Sulfolobus acidocaldarius DSM 639]